jgi:anaerobic magnesium-protoporphyrin IX monomethyl ester cyclase
MKKLALIYPNQRWLKNDVNTTWDLNPVTLCQLAAMVKHMVNVFIIDAQFYDLSIGDFRKKIENIGPDYVGISVLSSEYGETLDISASIIKDIDKDVVVIAGGIHPTIEYEDVAWNPDVDYVVRGEGEYVLIDLLSYLDGSGILPKEGLVFIDPSNNLVVQNQVIVSDLSSLPFPDYSYVNLHDYLVKGPRHGPLRPPELPYLRVNITRGCPFGCSFCQVESINGKKVRYRDPVDVVDWLISIRDEYGIKSILFDDDQLLGKRSYFTRLLELIIEKNLSLKFIINAFAIFLVTDEQLKLLNRAGCVGVNVAIESGSERVLKEIVMKPVKLDQAICKIKKIKEFGMFCIANFIIGFPGEKWSEIRQTISYAENCGADYVKFFAAVPLKRTKLWDLMVDTDSYDGNIENWSVEWRFGQISSDEWSSKDVSILRAYEWDRVNFGTPEKRLRIAELWGVSEERLDVIRKNTRDAVVSMLRGGE